jgi:hypothetical protein
VDVLADIRKADTDGRTIPMGLTKVYRAPLIHAHEVDEGLIIPTTVGGTFGDEFGHAISLDAVQRSVGIYKFAQRLLRRGLVLPASERVIKHLVPQKDFGVDIWARALDLAAAAGRTADKISMPDTYDAWESLKPNGVTGKARLAYLGKVRLRQMDPLDGRFHFAASSGKWIRSAGGSISQPAQANGFARRAVPFRSPLSQMDPLNGRFHFAARSVRQMDPLNGRFHFAARSS